MQYVEVYRNGWRCYLVISEGRKHIRLLDTARLETVRLSLTDWRQAKPRPIDTSPRRLAIRLEKRVRLFRRCGTWGPGKPRKLVRQTIADLRNEESRDCGPTLSCRPEAAVSFNGYEE